ncbi:MAG: ABC transporter ATP-binding protein [Chloroflexi bacterium]|nr:ABC transporter ATP-binding protein [Chloroflexota bacterium]
MNLTITNLGKEYQRDFWGLKDFTLDVQPGILGLLGPNGAGKSTFMRMLATITKPTTGTILWDNDDIVKNPDPLRAVLGYLPQDFGVYPNLNAIEFLEYMAAIKGLDSKSTKKRIDELLQVTNLADAAKRPLGGYSGGMKQRVGIAQALLNDPQLLIVDEPTVGLDPEERVRFRNLLSDLSEDRIVILSTHIVSDIESTATRIVLVNKGQLLRDSAPENLLKELDGKVWKWTVPSADLPALKHKHIISGAVRRRDGVELRIVSESSPHPQAAVADPNLEDAYLLIVKGEQS